MYAPSLTFLRSVVSPAIRQASVEQIKRSSTPATVYRLWLECNHERAPRSLVVKRIEEGWPGDARGHEREALFCRILLPQLSAPHPRIYYAGMEPGTSFHLVIMEDVADSHRFPPPRHTWTQKEIEQILRSYARLHASGRSCLESEEDLGWMMDRHEKRLLETAGELPRMVEALTAHGVWPTMSGLGALLEGTLRDVERLSDLPPTLLHNDVYAPNCGIPTAGEGEVVLVDWDMVGSGLAEMDLAFMFMQPYGSQRRLDRRAALAYYWRCRQMFDGQTPSNSEREERQRYADALWALWLVPVAFRVWESPFPPGSGPRNFWNSMFGVLGKRLQLLCDEA
jgi:thiamine kinase-like enzyme